ncbi:MAG: response regulator [Verrucomicrobia bacterium]|nr:response regulator [Verrucomicrobiota bacterium]
MTWRRERDDFIITRNLFSEVEQERYDLTWAATYDAGREQLLRGEHDLYLIDYRLGIHNGLDLLREAKRLGCAAPIIMLTGVGDQQVDIEAIKAGAADYLVKGQITPALLHRAVSHAVQRKRIEQQLRESEEQLGQAQKMELHQSLPVVAEPLRQRPRRHAQRRRTLHSHGSRSRPRVARRVSRNARGRIRLHQRFRHGHRDG